MSATPHAWLIDLDGTLYRPRLVQLGMAFELLCGGWFQVKKIRAFRREHEKLRLELQGAPEEQFLPSPFRVQLERAAQKLQLDPDELHSTIRAWMEERPGKWLSLARRRELLQEISAFRQQGGKTALVSDYPASKKLRALGCTELFDSVVANGEHPRLTRLKPAPDGFLLAAEELGVAPSECLVLGDRPDADGAAALAAQMQFRLIR